MLLQTNMLRKKKSTEWDLLCICHSSEAVSGVFTGSGMRGADLG